MSCSLLPSHVRVLGPGGWKAVSLWWAGAGAQVLCGPAQGDLFTTRQMSSCSPGPVAAQPQWTLADTPHSPSCFPREGWPRHQILHPAHRTCSLSHTCRAPAVSQALGGSDPALQEKLTLCLSPPYTHSPLSISHPLHALPTSDAFPSICSKPTPPLSLQTCHPLSKANLKVTSPQKPSWIAPAQACRFLPVLNSLALDYTGCLDSSPNCFMDDNNNSFC